MKKLFALLLTLAMALSLAACGGDKPADDAEPAGDGEGAAGEVFYLNFKPEQDGQWKELAKIYTEETGVPVTRGHRGLQRA